MSLADSLGARRDELAAELERLTAPPEAGASVGFGKRVGDGTSEAVERISSTLTARSIAASLAEVDRALHKLAEGSYGICDGCGEQISPTRMEAMPSKVTCVECAAGS